MQMSMDIGPGHQLQHSLQLTCSRDESTLTNARKHSRGSTSDSYDEGDELDFSSDESGQFDDAEEELGSTRHPTTTRSPSTHSVKRQRSNDWPFDQGDETNTTTTAASSTDRRWPFHGSGSKNPGSNSGSPRTTSRLSGNRGRRSRFVEGYMNDSVSEKPPSIFLRDASSKTAREGQQPSHKPSGIFRFGKAIASAFNPFGVLHNVSDIWKGPSETQKPADDTLARAEKAYAELKKAGYKGTVKGSYMQSMQGASSHDLPDQTWKSIQEKMDYKHTGRHSRQSSGEGMGSGGSIRSSIQELRKARSSLGIPSMSIIPGRRTDDVDFPEMRRQKSRKELQRQAKLLKRVSDLEEKLERARRELQELMSDEDVPSLSYCAEKPYSRKFVPGTLPSLPSERILQNRAASVPVSETAALPSPLGYSQRVEAHEIVELPSTTEKPLAGQTTPKPPSVSRAQSLTVDSPSRKRKSPDPQAAQAEKTPQADNADALNLDNSHGADMPYYDTDLTPSRKSKLPKMVRQDSPGSVERKQARDHEHRHDINGGRSPGEDRGRRSVQPLRSHSKRSPSQRRRASNSRNRGTPVASDTRTPSLRMKKGRANLRCDSNTITDEFILRHNDSEDKENQTQPQPPVTKFYHQENEEPLLDPDQITPSPSPTKRGEQSRYNHSYSYIPPVPPIPKDLAATAAKVDRRLAKEMGKKREAQTKKLQDQGQGQENLLTTSEMFRWPDDIF